MTSPSAREPGLTTIAGVGTFRVAGSGAPTQWSKNVRLGFNRC